MVDSVPSDKGYEVFDGELTHENDSQNFVDNDDGHILLKWGRGLKFKKCNMTPLQLSTKKYMKLNTVSKYFMYMKVKCEQNRQRNVLSILKRTNH